MFKNKNSSLYRPKLKDLSVLSRQTLKSKTGSLKKSGFRGLVPDFKKLLKPIGLGILILLVIIFLFPQVEKFKSNRKIAKRLAEEKRQEALLAEIKKQAASAQDFFNLGLEFLKNNKPLEAQLSLEEAIRLEPYFRDAHLYLGYIYFKANQLVSAEREAKRAIELDPTFDKPHLLLSEILKSQGNKEEAAASLKRAEALGRENSSIGGE